MFTFFLILASMAHAEDKCPEPYSDHPPAISVLTEAGPTLIVCGVTRGQPKTSDKRSMNGFAIFALVGAAAPQQIFRVSELEDFDITPTPKKGLILEELWLIKDDFLPVLVSKVTCHKNTCKLSSPKCGNRAPKNLYPTILADIDERKKELSKNINDNMPPYLDTMMDRAFAQALGGDKKAQDFFRDTNRQGDGAYAEQWTIANKRLKRAKQYGCL